MEYIIIIILSFENAFCRYKKKKKRIVRRDVYDRIIPETKKRIGTNKQNSYFFIWFYYIFPYNFENRCGNRLKRKSCLFCVCHTG